MRHLIYKVENLIGIDVHSQIARFEVQMRTRGASRVTSQSNGFSHLYDLIGFNQEFGEMTVYGFEAVAVTNDYLVSVSSAFISC